MRDCFVRGLLPALLIAATLLGVAPEPAPAQYSAPRYALGAEAPRWVDYFVSRSRLSSEGGEAVELTGTGGRIMWSLAPLAAPGRLALLDRVAVGGYLVHASAGLDERKLLHYGLETDVRVTRAPLAGRIEPLVTLAVGSAREREPGRRYVVSSGGWPGGISDSLETPWMPVVRTGIEFTTEPQTITTFTVTPGVGARVRLLPGVNLRSDLRSVIGLTEETRRYLELSGGISLSL